MSSELLQVALGKKRERERERERERKGWRRLLYPLTQKRAITALTPEISGKTQETSGSPETLRKTWKL
jgi:hypothetical protein